MGRHGNGPDATDRAGMAPARSACSHHSLGSVGYAFSGRRRVAPTRPRPPMTAPAPRATSGSVERPVSGSEPDCTLGAGVTVSASTVAGTVGAASVLGVVVGAASVAGVVGGASVLGVVSPQPAGRSRCKTPVFW